MLCITAYITKLCRQWGAIIRGGTCLNYIFLKSIWSVQYTFSFVNGKKIKARSCAAQCPVYGTDQSGLHFIPGRHLHTNALFSVNSYENGYLHRSFIDSFIHPSIHSFIHMLYVY